jgi:H+-translocating NAD(P) transhydrogenase subunit alpha
MTVQLDSGIGLLTIFVLAVFVGFEVVSKVSTTLHTPLMSGANAIHGVVLVGAILITGSVTSPIEIALGLVAIVLGTVNMVGGFVVTDRMLGMFAGRKPGRKPAGQSPAAQSPAAPNSTTQSPGADR